VVSKRRLVITAVLSGRSQSEVARAYGGSQGWISRLLARYAVEGDAAFEPRSRRPKSSPRATPPETVELVLRLRKELTDQGLDAGPQTIAWHLAHHHASTVSPATISRLLTRTGFVAPEALRTQPAPPTTLAELQALIDAFVEVYNHHLPHRSLEHRATPATAYRARPKAAPGDRSTDTHDRVRTDRVDTGGKITLRHQGTLYSIGIGRTHARTHVRILVQDRNITIINAATGDILRELVLDTTKRYQGTGRPPGPPRKKN
jgi:transposase